MPSDLESDIELEDETEEDEVLVEYDLAVYPSDLTLNGIWESWKQKEIEIPEFQRQFVWSIRQSSLLIESFLLGLPVPPVFFYITETNKSSVIDGQQRIRSICYFFEGYFGEESLQAKRQVFRLTGLAEDSPYSRKRFEDLSETAQRKLKNASVLRAINIRQLSPKSDNTSIYHIFERLNTGGTALKPQEVRNCVYPGPIVAALKNLNDDPNWRMIVGKNAKDRHQRDIELILRLFALYKEWDSYEKPMKEYLTRFMKGNRMLEEEKSKEFLDKFPIACREIIEALGRKPFHIRGPLNSSVLEAVMCSVLEGKADEHNLKENFKKFVSDKRANELTTASTTDTLILKDRMKLARKYLQ